MKQSNSVLSIKKNLLGRWFTKFQKDLKRVIKAAIAKFPKL